MKLTFFLIAFFLVLLRVYFSWAGHANRGDNEGNMTISSDNYIEQIKWSGKIKLSEDEMTIANISPGGYLKFRENEKKLSAKSNLQGQISYELYDGSERLNMDDSGKRFIAGVLQKMIAFGFNAEGRPERIYKKGGKNALLAEIPQIKFDISKAPYFALLFKSDSLTKDDLTRMIKQIDGLGTDEEKVNYLLRFTADQLRDSVISLPWLEAVEHISQDIQKSGLLAHLIGQGLASEEIFDRILNITDHFRADIDKENILARLIEKGAVPPNHFYKLIQVIGHFAADAEKENLYTKLMKESIKTEEQWISLINEVAQVAQDFEKSSLLVQIAQKMPKSENTNAAYLKAAKTIVNDTEYGKAMRAVE